MCVIRHSVVDWDCSKTQTLLETLKILNLPRGGFLCIFGSRTIVPISWMCKKQTSVSHSSTESEVISLDAGLRMDGVPAHDLWELVKEVLHSSNNVPVRGNPSRDEIQSKHHNTNNKTKRHGNRETDELSNVDYVATSAKPSHFEAMLYIFEDNEAVIKMIIKGRSPTLRHVSRTHRVALDWLNDRINLDPKILVKYVDTKNELADVLTKGNFTRDEWNHLLRLLNIVSFSVFSRSHFKLRNKSKIMSKRQQEGKPGEEERVVAKSKPVMSLVSKNANRSPMVDSGVSNSPEILGMQWQSSHRSGTGKPVARDVTDVNENTASSSQVWHQNENTRSGIGKPFAKTLNRLSETKVTRESLFNCTREIQCSEGDAMLHIKVKWDDLGNLHVSNDEGGSSSRTRLRRKSAWTKNTDFEQVKALFDVSQSVILNHKSEIYGMSTIEWNTTPWTRSTLQHDGANKLSKAKVQVHFDSVLRLGKIREHPTSNQKWKKQIGWFMESKDYQELNGLNWRRASRVRVVFFPRTRNTGSAPRDSKKRWHKTESNLKKLRIESSSCRCTMTSIGRKVKRTSKSVFRALRKSRLSHTDSVRDIGLFSDQELKRGQYGTHT